MKRPSTSRTILIGIMVLAVAAIIIAWADQSGLLDPVWKSLEHTRY